MKIWRFLSLAILFLCGWPFFVKADSGSRELLKIYYQENGLRRLLARPVVDVDSVFFTESVVPDTLAGEDPSSLILNVAPKGDAKVFSLPSDSVVNLVLGGNIPTIFIDTDSCVSEIPDKENYLTASFRYIPYGDGTDTVANNVSVRGRGNSSWSFPQKPYRLKFDKKQSIAGLPKAKSFVLISNYIDNTLMKNAVAFKIARLLGLDFTNFPVPVNVVLNGEERGNYMLTNKVGINSGSVDIDEKEGILWEVDINFDEEFKFHSFPYYLPCMAKDPDFYEIAEGDSVRAGEMWEAWKQDLNDALALVAAGEWDRAFEIDDLVKYFFVQNLALNRELVCLRSIFFYKKALGEKYRFGPVWDFDFAFGYKFNVDEMLLSDVDHGFTFLSDIVNTEVFQMRFQEIVDNFCENHLEELMDYIDGLASQMSDGAIQHAMIWPAEHYHVNDELRERNTNRFDENVELLKSFILDRIELIKISPTFAFF